MKERSPPNIKVSHRDSKRRKRLLDFHIEPVVLDFSMFNSPSTGNNEVEIDARSNDIEDRFCTPPPKRSCSVSDADIETSSQKTPDQSNVVNEIRMAQLQMAPRAYESSSSHGSVCSSEIPPPTHQSKICPPIPTLMSLDIIGDVLNYALTPLPPHLNPNIPQRRDEPSIFSTPVRPITMTVPSPQFTPSMASIASATERFTTPPYNHPSHRYLEAHSTFATTSDIPSSHQYNNNYQPNHILKQSNNQSFPCNDREYGSADLHHTSNGPSSSVGRLSYSAWTRDKKSLVAVSKRLSFAGNPLSSSDILPCDPNLNHQYGSSSLLNKILMNRDEEESCNSNSSLDKKRNQSGLSADALIALSSLPPLLFSSSHKKTDESGITFAEQSTKNCNDGNDGLNLDVQDTILTARKRVSFDED